MRVGSFFGFVSNRHNPIPVFQSTQIHQVNDNDKKDCVKIIKQRKLFPEHNLMRKRGSCTKRKNPRRENERTNERTQAARQQSRSSLPYYNNADRDVSARRTTHF